MAIKYLGKHESKEHSDKMKTEKEKHEKEIQKEHKDDKDKEKEKEKEKEGQKEYKDKDKEKEHGKEHGKELFIGEHPQAFMQAAVTQASASAQTATAALPAKVADAEKIPEKLYKFEHEKHFVLDKLYKPEKEHYEAYVEPIHIDPGGPIEQRLAALEAAVQQLVHFIPQELRPDLSKGALKQEPKETEPEPAEVEKKKK